MCIFAFEIVREILVVLDCIFWSVLYVIECVISDCKEIEKRSKVRKKTRKNDRKMQKKCFLSGNYGLKKVEWNNKLKEKIIINFKF